MSPDQPARRVLVLEDEFLISDSLRIDLEGLGIEVLGPAPDCSAALELLWQAEPDLAILDTHLGSETCEVVLAECQARSIPVVIFSAQAPGETPAFALGLPTLAEPYLVEHLHLALAS